jgi:hypothetical protein
VTVVLVSEGTPAADALAGWLSARLPGARQVTAVGAADVARVVASRRGLSERVVTLGGEGGDLSGRDALRAVETWLAHLGPFERRVAGPACIDARIAEGAADAGDVLALLNTLSRGRPRLPATGRRGRPAGSDPFRGAGFDACVALLLEPDRAWTERDLAAATGRSAYGVHRVLVELEKRGYLDRTRGATSVRDTRLLRDDLAAAWAARLANGREAVVYAAPRRTDVAATVAAAARAAGCRALLAGPSATQAAIALAGRTTVMYADAGVHDSLRAVGFEPVRRLAGDLVIWAAPEEAVFSAPRTIGSLPATNRVVTYLDLASADVDRYGEAAEAVWSEAA